MSGISRPPSFIPDSLRINVPQKSAETSPTSARPNSSLHHPKPERPPGFYENRASADRAKLFQQIRNGTPAPADRPPTPQYTPTSSPGQGFSPSYRQSPFSNGGQPTSFSYGMPTPPATPINGPIGGFFKIPSPTYSQPYVQHVPQHPQAPANAGPSQRMNNMLQQLPKLTTFNPNALMEMPTYSRYGQTSPGWGISLHRPVPGSYAMPQYKPTAPQYRPLHPGDRLNDMRPTDRMWNSSQQSNTTSVFSRPPSPAFQRASTAPSPGSAPAAPAASPARRHSLPDLKELREKGKGTAGRFARLFSSSPKSAQGAAGLHSLTGAQARHEEFMRRHVPVSQTFVRDGAPIGSGSFQGITNGAILQALQQIERNGGDKMSASYKEVMDKVIDNTELRFNYTPSGTDNTITTTGEGAKENAKLLDFDLPSFELGGLKNQIDELRRYHSPQ